MAAITNPQLTADEIDDLLYFTRVNEEQELRGLVSELAQKYQSPESTILEHCVDPASGNTVLHYCAANGLAGASLRFLALTIQVLLLTMTLVSSDLLPGLLSYVSSPSSTESANGKYTESQQSFINRRNIEGNTALHWASLNGHLPIVKMLVPAGADLWIKNAAGHFAMFEAERADKGEVVQYLLEAGGAEVEKTGTEGQASAEDVEEVDAESANKAAGSTTRQAEDVEMAG